MVKYVLHYFGVNGRAVVPRAILTYVKADWEDDRISQQVGQKLKKVDFVNLSKFQYSKLMGKNIVKVMLLIFT